MGWVGVVTDAGKELFASYAQSGLTLSVDSVKTGSGTMEQSAMHGATALVTQKDVGVVDTEHNSFSYVVCSITVINDI